MKQLRKVYDAHIAERSRLLGWADESGGRTGNLSGHQGSLSHSDKQIKQILMDLEEKEAAKDLKEDDKRKLEKNEQEAIVDKYSKGAHKKRKLLDANKAKTLSSTPLSAATAMTTPFEAGTAEDQSGRPSSKPVAYTSPVDSWIMSQIAADNKPTTTTSTSGAVTNPFKAALCNYFKAMPDPMGAIVFGANLEPNSLSEGIVRGLGYKVLVECCFKNKEFNIDHFRPEVVNHFDLHAYQLSIYMEEVAEEVIKII